MIRKLAGALVVEAICFACERLERVLGPRAPTYSESIFAMPDRDLSKLHPSFRARVETLISRMHARGFDAYVHEGYRTKERAAELAAKGTGVALSMHCFGLAVDIISQQHKWNAPAAFWTALGVETERLGLTWGGNFKRRADRPHVQALPAAHDARVRKLASAGESAAIDALVAARWEMTA